jgi:uncharacterized protein YqeY
MGLKERLQQDLIEATKSRNELKTGVIRLLRGMIRKQEIDQRKEFGDDDIIGVLASAVKQRRESIKAYADGGRADLVAQEQAELAIIESYLPQALSTQELEKIVQDTIAETGATSIKDLGKVMAKVMPQIKGRADGTVVQAMVRSKLT